MPVALHASVHSPGSQPKSTREVVLPICSSGPGTTSPAEATKRERAVALLGDAEGGHRAVLDVELDRHAPAALAVVDAEAAQQRPALADREVRRAVVAHLDDAVAEVQCLQLGERAAAAETVDDEHRQ